MNNQDRLPESILVLTIELDFYFSETLSESVILLSWTNYLLLLKITWSCFLRLSDCISCSVLSHSLSSESLTKSAEKYSLSTSHLSPVVWPELIKGRVRP